MKKPILRPNLPYKLARWLLLAGTVMSLTFWACGKKDLPIAPRTIPPPAVSNLQGQKNGDIITLSWRLPDGKTAVDNGLYEFRIWRAQQGLTLDSCPECPVKFKMAGRLPVRDMALTPDGNLMGTYREPAVPGYSLTYHVVGYTRSGVAGDRSNLVHVVCPQQPLPDTPPGPSHESPADTPGDM